MDLLYGNDGTNYRTLAKSAEMTREAEQLLENTYMSYYPVRTRAPYSGPEMEPESIYYVTSDLGGALPEEHIILAKNGRMTTTATPSTYLHAHLVKAGAEAFRDHFFDIFRIRFIRPTEIDSYTDRPLTGYVPSLTEPVNPRALTDDQIRAVLSVLFENNRVSRPVKMISDVTGDGYNRRSREILASIYRYLPYQLRRKLGFASYMGEAQRGIPRVSIEIFDRSQLKNPEAMDLDLANIDMAAVRAKIRRREISDYVDHLISMSDDERESTFRDLEKTFAGTRVVLESLLKYEKYGALARKWDGRPVSDVMPEWVDSVFENSMTGGPAYRMLVSNISERLTNEAYNDYLFGLLREENADLANLPERIRRTLILSDEIEKLSVDPKRLREYYEKRQKSGDKGTLSAEGLRREAERLREVRIGSPSYQSILSGLADELDRRAAALEPERRPEKNGLSAGSGKAREVRASAPAKKQILKITLSGPEDLIRILRFLSENPAEDASSALRVQITYLDFTSPSGPTMKMNRQNAEAFVLFLLAPSEKTYAGFKKFGFPADGASRARVIRYLNNAGIFNSSHLIWLKRIAGGLTGSDYEEVRAVIASVASAAEDILRKVSGTGTSLRRAGSAGENEDSGFHVTGFRRYP